MREHNWRFVKDIAVRLLSNKSVITQSEVEDIFVVANPTRDVVNVAYELKRLSVNSQSRLSYLPLYGKVNPSGKMKNENKKNSPLEYPRISDPKNENDTLFFLGDGLYELYDPSKHGVFIIILDENDVNTIVLIINGESEFYSLVSASLKLSRQQRLSRLDKAETIPERVEVERVAFKRNPDVVAERLFIAQGFCDDCHQFAPFNRKSDNSPYLEVHHIVTLANGGADTVENTVALCANCHRKRHFG